MRSTTRYPRTRNLRKSVLCMAMGVCLSSLAVPVMAQSVTGAVAGQAEAGARVTITNNATGVSRTVTVDQDGNYRIGQLQPWVCEVAASEWMRGLTVYAPVSPQGVPMAVGRSAADYWSDFCDSAGDQ